VNGGSGAGKVVDFIDLDVQRKRHVVANELESRVRYEMGHVVAASRVEVIDAQHIGAVCKQALAQMRAEEAGSAGDENSAHVSSLQHLQGLSALRVLFPAAAISTRYWCAVHDA
jgi:hypothetical protein